MKKDKEIFYAVVCEEAGICGAFVSRKEAKEWAEDIKDCPAKHKIKKCQIKLLDEEG